MKISGFTMCRNAAKLYYPIKQSIMSALPLVDEYIVALGNGDEDDCTAQLISEINSPKIKIIRTVWDLEKFPNGMVHAQQTDLAKQHCTGDWLIYLQADEVLHELDFEAIKTACSSYLEDDRVEGFLLNYHHFWGDYEHVVKGHSWYDREVRIIRNKPDIHSWQSAQSFRVIQDFNGIDFRQKVNTRKLNVMAIHAHIYHYGWVRPPKLMTQKMQALDKIHSHQRHRFKGDFDYGDLSRLAVFKGMHPKVMQEWMQGFDWKNDLNYGEKKIVRSYQFKHERLRYRILSWIEIHLFGGEKMGAFKNYTLLD